MKSHYIKNFIGFFFFVLIITSCSVNKQVAVIYSGDITEMPIIEEPTGEIIDLGDNETFATYKEDSMITVSPSNEIKFGLKQREKVKSSWKRNKKGKKQYAFVDVHKYYYKFQIWRPVVSIVAIPLTYTTSLFYYPPTPHTKKLIVTEQLKKDDLVERSIYKKRILIETRIWCKKDKIHENVVVVENLPDGFTVDGYKVKEKRGKRRIEDIKYEKKQIDNNECHVFTLTPANAEFKRKNKVWIILDVTIKPEEQHKIDKSYK